MHTVHDKCIDLESFRVLEPVDGKYTWEWHPENGMTTVPIQGI